jgi:peptidyl-tRNA hydrolase
MSPGKITSQAGHAYLGAFLEAQVKRPFIAEQYAAESPGTKVCLRASGQQLFRAKQLLEEAGLPCYLVIDSGCANFFNGEPTPTALGFGPATEDELPKYIQRLQLL